MYLQQHYMRLYLCRIISYLNLCPLSELRRKRRKNMKILLYVCANNNISIDNWFGIFMDVMYLFIE